MYKMVNSTSYGTFSAILWPEVNMRVCWVGDTAVSEGRFWGRGGWCAGTAHCYVKHIVKWGENCIDSGQKSGEIPSKEQ